MKTESVTTANFSMDYFTFGHGKQPLVILPGISLSRVMKSKELVAGNYSCDAQAPDELEKADARIAAMQLAEILTEFLPEE